MLQCVTVAFECVNDAKKNDWNIYMYFHMEPGENRTEVRKQWIYAMDLDFHRVPCVCHVLKHIKNACICLHV